MSRVIPICFGFALKLFEIFSRNLATFLSIQKTIRGSSARVFPRFVSAACICLIGSTDYLRPLWLRSLIRHNDDAKANVDKRKFIFYVPTNLAILLFHLLCLSLSKLSRNWIWDKALNLKQKFKTNSRRGSCSPDKAEFDHLISRCCFAEGSKELYTKNYNECAQPLFFSLNLKFSDVPIAVAVVVFLNSLVARVR